MTDPLASKRMIIGIGAQKAGTSWLHRQLARHPHVFMSPIKELHYFDAFFASGVFQRFNTRLQDEFAQALQDPPGAGAGLEWFECLADRVSMTNELDSYRDYFRKRVKAQHLVFGEITPSYAALDEAGFTAIRSVHSDIRLVFVLRDPVDRLISAMSVYNRRAGRTSNPLDVLAGLQRPDIVARCRYDLTLQRIDRAFDQEQVFVGFYEHMFAPRFSGALAGFLGMDSIGMDITERPNASPGKPISDTALIEELRRALAPVYDFCRERFGPALPSSWRR